MRRKRGAEAAEAAAAANKRTLAAAQAAPERPVAVAGLPGPAPQRYGDLAAGGGGGGGGGGDASDDDDDDEDDWEDEVMVDAAPAPMPGDGEPLVVELKRPGDAQEDAGAGKKRRRRTPEELEAARTRRALLLEMHRMHVVCYLAHGIQRSCAADDELVQALLVSMLPRHLLLPRRARPTPLFVKRLVSWITERFGLGRNKYMDRVFPTHGDRMRAVLAKRIRTVDPALLVDLFVATCRGLALETRLVCSFYPMPFRESAAKRALAGTLLAPDRWAEVFVDGRWITASPLADSADQPLKIEKRGKTVSYVASFRDAGVRDLTRKYATQWSKSVALRTAEDWVEQTLSVLAFDNDEVSRQRNEAEEREMQAAMRREGLPTSVNAYKTHPLYALDKFLSIVQIIHPPDAPVLGYCGTFAVYSRDNVHTLRSAFGWKKEGREVLPNEDGAPVRTIEARHVTSTNMGETKLYGRWQTREYDPGAVVDGVVPRNEYGNVEIVNGLVPRGAVHLDAPRVRETAKRLGIDAPPAMLGWEVVRGRPTPIVRGVVVADDLAPVLAEAAAQEEARRVEEARRKTEVQVLKRWQRLARGLLIRARLFEEHGVDARQ